MNKKIKILIFSIALLLSVIGINSAITILAKAEIKKAISNNDTINLTYEDFTFNLLTNTFKAQHIIFENNSLQKMNIDKIIIKGVSWFQLVKNKTIDINNIEISNPKFSLKKDRAKTTPRKAIKSKSATEVFIKNIQINNGSLIYTAAENSSVETFNLNITDFKLNDKTLSRKVLFDYHIKNADFFNIKSNLNSYEALKIKNISIQKNHTFIDSLTIKSRFSKQILSTKLNEERSHMDILIPKMKLSGLSLSSGTNFHLKTDTIFIEQPKLLFYKDKSLPDKTAYKPLYSESLSKLKFLISLPKIIIKDGYVNYEALMKKDKKAGTIYFKNINATLGLSNKIPQDFIKLKAQASFMGKSPTNLTINFKKLKNNYFTASGDIQKFKTKHINTFLYNILNTQLEGDADEIYFTIAGNNKIATGQVKMKYDNLKLKFMRKDVYKVNKLISSVGNMLINNGSKTDENGYRNGAIKTERIQTKSLFNFLWLSLKDGIIDTLTGKPTL